MKTFPMSVRHPKYLLNRLAQKNFISGAFNPFRPGVLGPGNNPGGFGLGLGWVVGSAENRVQSWVQKQFFI